MRYSPEFGQAAAAPADPGDVKISTRFTMIMVGVLAVVLVAAVGGYLLYTDGVAGEKLRHDVTQRARIAGHLTVSALNASDAQNRDYVNQSFIGDSAAIQAVLDAEASDSPNIVMTDDGVVLAAYPHDLRGVAGQRLAAPVLTLIATQNAERMVLGNLVTTPDGQMHLLFGLPFTIDGERRVWIFTAPVETIDSFARAYLSSALDVGGGRAYILDGNKRVIASSTDDPLGEPLADPDLAAALERRPSGIVGTDYYTSATASTTDWQIVFAVSERALMAPVQATRKVAWQLFAAFFAAMICMVLLGATALSRSARLAHERLHDALTGLPNRILFLSRARQALAGRRRQDGKVAVLFIDLDGFKPINDVHGHAAGDALLIAAAKRLKDTIRSGDLVSRFGGDEFLVLCPSLLDDQQAIAIAERLRQEIARPFQIEGNEVTVGSSIGVALNDQGVNDATALIHNADLAMYEAKKGGRGRIHRFDSTTAAPYKASASPTT
jgi:diguanylate cyclase (GGDEF)-like protein